MHEVSERKAEANRRNSRRSSGPRSAAGKARVRRNALRHGLASQTIKDFGAALKIERLALRISKDANNSLGLDEAIKLAEAQFDFDRVAAAAVMLINASGIDHDRKPRDHETEFRPTDSTPQTGDERDLSQPQHALPQLVRIGRYRRRAHRALKQALRALAP